MSESSLVITLPDDLGTLTLIGVDAPAGHIRATAFATLQKNYNSTVYLAATDDGQRIVLKFAFTQPDQEALEAEVRAYTVLLPQLQGTVVPRFLGFYRGTDKKGKQVCCIIVGGLGEGVKDRLTNMTCNERMEIFKQIGHMHLAGLQPMIDLGGENVVRADDGFRIVNFQQLQEHECLWDGNLHEGETIPELEDLKCEALLECGKELGVWKPFQFPLVYIEGQSYIDFGTQSSSEIDTAPPSLAEH